MTTVETYTAIYGGFDTIRWQPVPVRLFTEETHPLPFLPGPRLQAKWWKLRPDLACPDADVSIWIDGSINILRPDFPDLCLAALGDADAIFMAHPERDDIYEEAAVSLHFGKYDGMPLLEQVCSYRRAGHPEHWGLFHAALLVRRNTPAVQALDEAWWAENVRWSIQDQLSLPSLLRTMPLDYRVFDVSPIQAGWVHWDGGHAQPGVWRP